MKSMTMNILDLICFAKKFIKRFFFLNRVFVES
jgi:hypothetical protein